MAKDMGCYQCRERKAGCHSTCERYKEWKTKHDARQAEIRAQRDEENRAVSFEIESKIKTIRRRGDRA